MIKSRTPGVFFQSGVVEEDKMGNISLCIFLVSVHFFLNHLETGKYCLVQISRFFSFW